ncbi:hypothetical protein BV121_749 [Haemophilus influenzae]|nr:hypothetical protein BV121_749 [Haemophilus influenzae]AVJ01209.1 hypothetical protein BV122_752 [Haemophilus influenzae]
MRLFCNIIYNIQNLFLFMLELIEGIVLEYVLSVLCIMKKCGKNLPHF